MHTYTHITHMYADTHVYIKSLISTYVYVPIYTQTHTYTLISECPLDISLGHPFPFPSHLAPMC